MSLVRYIYLFHVFPNNYGIVDISYRFGECQLAYSNHINVFRIA